MERFDQLYFDAVLDGLVRIVKIAARSDWGDGGWIDPVGRAVHLAKHAMQETRRLGLYPTTDQLEAECRKAA